MSSKIRYFANDLKLVDTDEQSLQQALEILQTSIEDAIHLIIHYAEHNASGENRNSIYIGNSGMSVSSSFLSQMIVDVCQQASS